MKRLIEPIRAANGRVTGLYVKPGVSLDQLKKRLYEFEKEGVPPRAIKRLKTEGRI